MQPRLVDQKQFFIQMAPRTLEYLEELFNLSYPLRKIDQLILPHHRFFAMENWGLVTFSEPIHIPVAASVVTQNENEATLAHEYVHQWFGNMVTMRWWDDLWLKEGPSTYFGYLVLDALQPQLRRAEGFIQSDLAKFFKMDSGSSVPAISKEVTDPNTILGHFSTYVYEKGSLIVRMLHRTLGSDVFFNGIRSFLKKYNLQNADQKEFFEAFQELAVSKKVIPEDFDLNKAMESWTLQGGYPLVTLTRNYESGTISLIQSRFLLGPGKENISSCWWVPLSFVRQEASNFSQTIPESWLECPSSESVLQLSDPPGPDEWLILNPQVSSIFRVNYDDRNWLLIANSLKNDPSFGGIHEFNRAQLLDDVSALAEARIRGYDQVFDLFEYLKNDTGYHPWNRAVQVLNRRGALLTGQEEVDFKVSSFTHILNNNPFHPSHSIDLHEEAHPYGLRTLPKAGLGFKATPISKGCSLPAFGVLPGLSLWSEGLPLPGQVADNVPSQRNSAGSVLQFPGCGLLLRAGKRWPGGVLRSVPALPKLNQCS